MLIRSWVAFVLFSLFISSFCLNQHGLKTPENYGPYVLGWHSYGLCKGPKAVNVTQVTFHLNKDDGTCVYNFTFLEEARLDEVKVTVFSENDGAKNILWNYRIKDPCRHFMVESIIKPFLETENCVVKKGFYSQRLNFYETSKTFLGASFFYGTFIFKSIISSKSGNILCFEIEVEFTKRQI